MYTTPATQQDETIFTFQPSVAAAILFFKRRLGARGVFDFFFEISQTCEEVRVIRPYRFLIWPKIE
jgi:hypothetical protein